MSSYGFSTRVALPFDQAVTSVTDALKAEGFGVLTEIDLQAKLREKLGVEVPANVILGACHPPSAHRALEAKPEVAVLLPCNVCVATEARDTVIRAMNPEVAMSMLGGSEIEAVAQEVAAALRRVVTRVAS